MNRNEAKYVGWNSKCSISILSNKTFRFSQKRQNQVLDKMVRYEFITAKEKEEILNESNAVEDNKD